MQRSRRLFKEATATVLKEEVARANAPAPTRPMPRRRGPLDLAVAVRRQTHEQQRQFNTALDGFLAEWVRQHLEAEKAST
jgi:hypothetical protein